MFKEILRKDARLLRVYLRISIANSVLFYPLGFGLVWWFTGTYMDEARQTLAARSLVPLAGASLYGLCLTYLFAAMNAAIQNATEAIDTDRSALSPKESREADHYRLAYGLRWIILNDRDNKSELNELLTRTRRHIEQSTQVSSKEASVAGSAMITLDLAGRTEDALQTADLIESQFSELADSRHKSSVLNSLVGIRNRMRMLNTQLDWQTRSIDGVPLDTRDLHGKVVLVEFWLTTCGPCIADFPALKRIYSTYHDEGFEVLGVCLHASAAKIQSFTEKHELPWIQVCHDVVEGNAQWAEQFGINTVPSTMLVDQSGRIIAFGIQPLHESKQRDLEACLKAMLGKE